MPSSNVKYNRVDIEIKKGAKDFSVRQVLEKGICLGVRFIAFVKEPAHSVNISVDDSQGNTLLTGTDYRDYAHAGGGYFQGLKQVNFKTDNNAFLIQVKCSRELEEDFFGQLIFTIEKEE